MAIRRSTRPIAVGLAATVVAAVLATGTALGAGASPSAERASKGTVHYAPPVARTMAWEGVTPAPPEGEPDYRFLSSPDFMNADLADLSRLRNWRPSMPNSWNSSYASTIDTILDTFESEAPQDVLVAGDLVNGHWGGHDTTGIFGPTNTPQQRVLATKRAADFYFSRWRRLFDARDLPVYAAVGDHDIGDNPWRGGRDPEQARFKREHQGVFKSSFFRKVVRPSHVSDRPAGPAHDTAYATYLSPEVLLVTVNVFQRTRDNVIPELDRAQLAWLDRTLAAGERRGTDWIVVQGHVPVLKPVRSHGSSAIYYKGGAKSPFWRTMAKHHVDLYLHGEVHEVSVRRADGITQVSHGGTVGMPSPRGYGATNYLLGEVFGDTMWLRDNLFTPTMVDFSHQLWQLGGKSHRPVAHKRISSVAPAIGHLVLTRDNQLVYSDGALIPLS